MVRRERHTFVLIEAVDLAFSFSLNNFLLVVSIT